MTATISKASALEILQSAKQALIEDGWTQGVYHRPKIENGSFCGESHCAIGALEAGQNRLVGDDVDPFDDNAFNTAYWALTNALPKGFVTVPRWNDQEGRTVDEVIALYDEAIKAVERL